jgi:protein-L-isoaspartate O-methyltransferase
VPLNKTISRADRRTPAVKGAGARLRWFMWQRFLLGEAFAVNGSLRRRWRVRWHKLWEYERGLAYVPWQPDWRVLDFGGGATLPVLYLASQGLHVSSYDIDANLTRRANALARRHGWPLEGSTHDLTTQPLALQNTFDWVMSFCVLEHLPRGTQLSVARLLADYLKPGGCMTLTFDYSPEAPVTDALRTPQDVEALVAATGLKPVDGALFEDSGERFILDDKYPQARFTFGSLFLRKG